MAEKELKIGDRIICVTNYGILKRMKHGAIFNITNIDYGWNRTNLYVKVNGAPKTWVTFNGNFIRLSDIMEQ